MLIACKNKPTSVLHAINRVNTFLPVSGFKTTYCTLVYLYLTYGISFYAKENRSFHIYLTKKVQGTPPCPFMYLNVLNLHDIYELEVGKCM